MINGVDLSKPQCYYSIGIYIYTCSWRNREVYILARPGHPPNIWIHSADWPAKLSWFPFFPSPPTHPEWFPRFVARLVGANSYERNMCTKFIQTSWKPYTFNLENICFWYQHKQYGSVPLDFSLLLLCVYRLSVFLGGTVCSSQAAANLHSFRYSLI